MEYRLKEIGTIITGGTPKTKNAEYYSKKDYLFIGPTDIKECKYVRKSEKYISNEAYKDYKKKFIGKNSIMIDCIGSDMGNVAISVNDVLTNQQINTITNIDEKNFNVEYIYYVLSTMKKYFHQIGTNGSTMPIINKTMFEDIIIDIPDKTIQDKIATILSKLDQKIELNNQINDNLYELLKVEFKTKFYNKNSDAKLLDFISNTIGGDWGKELPLDNYNTKVYCVRGADIPNMEYGNKGNAPTRYILEKNYNNKKLKPNNIIIEISGGSPTQSTGRTAYITENILNMYDAPLLCTNFCRAIETKKNIYAPFVYMYLTLMYEDDIFFNWENGTTGIKNLALNDLLLNIEITQPNEEELNKYYILFNSIMNKISNNSNENIKLEVLRDTLLPKLMIGEIDLDKIEI